MKLIKLNHAVRVRFNPYIITSKRLFLSRVGMDLFLGMLLINTWVSPYSIPIKSVLSLIFIGIICSIEKFLSLFYIKNSKYTVC